MPFGFLRKRVFVTRPIPRPPLERLAAHVTVELWDRDRAIPHDELLRRLKDVDAVLSMLTDHFDQPTIEQVRHLDSISNCAVGVDNIDLEAATAAGIPVGHTPGVLTETTADLAFALMVAAARRLPEADRYVRAGRWTAWSPDLLLGRDIFGATLGIIGWGAIGRAMARRALGFQMRVLYMKRPPRTTATDSGPPRDAAGEPAGAEGTTLDRLLAESDFVSLHVPLTVETRHMIGGAELAAMKPGAILVNTARGGVVDQAALVVALRSGHLGGAALDVTETEPIDPQDELLKLPNVLVTPHIGSATYQTRLRIAETAVDNLLDVFAGRLPRFCANPTVLMRHAARQQG